MNLVIDLGNTQAKAAVFYNRELKKKYVFDKTFVAEVRKILSEFPEIKYSIVSSVISHSKELVNFLQAKTNCIDFDFKARLPFTITYKTIETLGKDRIAAVAGGMAIHPDTPLLIIDAGTCIKYNFVTEKSEFTGGAISPGLAMRFKALNTFTDKLPHLSFENNFNEIIGTSTRTSILSGVQQGILFEIEGYMRFFKEKNKQGIVLVTGGDSQFLADALKNSIFATPDLILSGLNEILLHQHR